MDITCCIHLYSINQEFQWGIMWWARSNGLRTRHFVPGSFERKTYGSNEITLQVNFQQKNTQKSEFPPYHSIHPHHTTQTNQPPYNTNQPTYDPKTPIITPKIQPFNQILIPHFTHFLPTTKHTTTKIIPTTSLTLTQLNNQISIYKSQTFSKY